MQDRRILHVTIRNAFRHHSHARADIRFAHQRENSRGIQCNSQLVVNAAENHAHATVLKPLDDLGQRVDARRIHEGYASEPDYHALDVELHAFQRALQLFGGSEEEGTLNPIHEHALRKLDVLVRIIIEDLKCQFFRQRGIAERDEFHIWYDRETVSLGWLNDQLVKLGHRWRVELVDEEYQFADTDELTE